MARKDAEEIKRFVRKRYGARAQAAGGCCGPATAPKYAERLYSQEELAGVPQSASDLSLGCGNPVAFANLEAGQVALDLGSGGGIDCFLAAQQVGPEGRVIGLDMTSEMIRLARENARKMGLENVEFRLGEMESMPVETSSVDVVISNCVINLSPDKEAVFREAWRVLKPGGRLCVSDVTLQGELPPQVKESLDQWAGCVAGALERGDYLKKLYAAGFAEVSMEPLYSGDLFADAPCGEGDAPFKDSVVAMLITARKPPRPRR